MYCTFLHACMKVRLILYRQGYVCMYISKVVTIWPTNPLCNLNACYSSRTTASVNNLSNL